MTGRVALPVLVAVLLALPVLAVPAAGQLPGAVPSGIVIENPEAIPNVLQPGVQTEVELVIRYQYTVAEAGVGDTRAHISAPNLPTWFNVQFQPDSTWTMDLPPTQQSTTHNVTMVLRLEVDAPAVMPDQLTLHTVAEKNGLIAGSENSQQFFLEAAFVPKLSIDLTEHPVVVPRESTKVTTFSVTNLGNAPVTSDFRLVRTPPDTQAGISTDSNVIGTEQEHEDHSVRSTVSLLVQDLGGSWEQEHVTMEVLYRPTRRPDHPAAFQSIKIQLVRPIAPVTAEVAGTFVLVGAAAVGGAWFVHKRREVFWPEDGQD